MAAEPATTPPTPDSPRFPTPLLAQSLRDRVEGIERRAARDDAGAYRDGQELVAIDEGRLWRHGGYRGMNDLLQRGLRRLPASTARQRWQVARHLPGDFVRRHGLLKCYFGLRIVGLDAVRPSPAALERLAIDAERAGRMVPVPFALATTNEVRRAAAWRRPSADPLRGLSPRWRARLLPLVRALRPYAAATGRPALSISTRGRAPDRALVQIAIPLDQLALLHRALGAVLGVRAATGRATAGTAPRPVRSPDGAPARASKRLATRGSRVRRRSARPVARQSPAPGSRASTAPHPAAPGAPARPPTTRPGRPRSSALPRVQVRSRPSGGRPCPGRGRVVRRRRGATRRRRRRRAPP